MTRKPHIGIIDFNPDQNPDRRQYVKRIGSLIPADVSIDGLFFKQDFDISKYDSLILSGSKLSATDYQRMVKLGEITGADYQSVHTVTQMLSQYGKPMFGVCFGSQLIAHVMGGELGKLDKTEAGYLEHKLTEQGKNDAVFGHLPETFYGAHLHSDYVKELPKRDDIKSEILATKDGFIHAYKVIEQNGVVRYGVQPHPEMSNPSDATFLVSVNENWLKPAIGENEYKQAQAIPKKAEYELAKTITHFIRLIKTGGING